MEPGGSVRAPIQASTLNHYLSTPNKLFECLGAGLPVVATRSGGPEEIVTDEVDGLLVPIAEPGRLAAALLRIIEDPSLGRRVAAAASVTAAQRFSLLRMTDAYDALYAAVAPPRASR